MSDCVIFEIRSKHSARNLSKELGTLWTGFNVEVLERPESDTFICVLLYWFGTRQEANAVLTIVNFLQTASSDGVVRYYRDFDSMTQWVEYSRSLRPHETF